MSLAVYVNASGFVKQPGERFDESYQRGFQILIETWRGPHAGLDDFLNETKPLESIHPTFPAMVLADRTTARGIGFTSVDLVYWGFRDSGALTDSGTGIITVDSSIELINVSVSTDEEDEFVDFKYNAPTTTVGWLYFGTAAPALPRFAGVLASGISIQLFDPYPPDYVGIPQTEFVLRNVAFRRTRIAPKIWAVVEINQVRVEPDVVKPIVIST